MSMAGVVGNVFRWRGYADAYLCASVGAHHLHVILLTGGAVYYGSVDENHGAAPSLQHVNWPKRESCHPRHLHDDLVGRESWLLDVVVNRSVSNQRACCFLLREPMVVGDAV